MRGLKFNLLINLCGEDVLLSCTVVKNINMTGNVQVGGG